ncbi:hypothetical protein ACNKHT_03890 [Shigella flexneri]
MNWRSTFQQLPGTGVKPDQFHSKRVNIPPPGERRFTLPSTISDPDTNVSRSSPSSLTHTASVVTSMRISIRWDCGSKINWPIWIRLSTYLTEADFQDLQRRFICQRQRNHETGELLEALKQTYCGPIGAEYMHITSTEENAGSNSVSSLVARLSIAKRKSF